MFHFSEDMLTSEYFYSHFSPTTLTESVLPTGRHINIESEFANELGATGKTRLNSHDIFTALSRIYDRLEERWAYTAMLAGFGIIVSRCLRCVYCRGTISLSRAFPRLIRHVWDQKATNTASSFPLLVYLPRRRDTDSEIIIGIGSHVLSSRPSAGGQGVDYMMASESVALLQLGCKRAEIRDVLPGEAVIIPKCLPRYLPKSKSRKLTARIFLNTIIALDPMMV